VQDEQGTIQNLHTVTGHHPFDHFPNLAIADSQLVQQEGKMLRLAGKKTLQIFRA